MKDILSGKGYSLLKRLSLIPSFQSADYVKNKTQFHLHTLPTEQRHPATFHLSRIIQTGIPDGLKQILSVDKDIVLLFERMADSPAVLEAAGDAAAQTLSEGKKIFIYGCGSTGRLAKQMESALWRPFWHSLPSGAEDRTASFVPDDIRDRLIGEMTGGDRAFISALEGFEDLELVGRLQLADRHVVRGDCVFCITEGGETSSVIGAILAAADLYGKPTPETIKEARQRLFFICNNPEDILRSYDRSRRVLNHNAVRKINLTTGPQAITGSTRMQAATSETYVMGLILERGIYAYLQQIAGEKACREMGFSHPPDMAEGLRSFSSIYRLLASSVPDLAHLTALEAETYTQGGRTTYFAKSGLATVFTDAAERSPTFHLHPLDSVREEERKCWIQVWTEAESPEEAWTALLGRPFRGLHRSFYRPRFLLGIDDSFLQKTALASLEKAGDGQAAFYDFSFSKGNIQRRGPEMNDLGVAICLGKEADEALNPDSSFFQFIRLFKSRGAAAALILIGGKQNRDIPFLYKALSLNPDRDVILAIPLDLRDDPLQLRRQVLLKMLLNAHSTGVMARLGRVVGNTMTSVYPSNLKLIGRATHLILEHVNHTLEQKGWTALYGRTEPITYAEANAVLFDAISFCGRSDSDQSETGVSIVRILEALRTKVDPGWETAQKIAADPGLEDYLDQFHSPE